MLVGLSIAALPVVEASVPYGETLVSSGADWPLLLALVTVGLTLGALAYGFFLQRKAIKLLTKECRRVSTVAVGMGQHIQAIEKHILGLGQDAQQQHDELVAKARDLLISGASIDEVTQYSGLSHAEVSLIASLSKSNKANNVHPLNNFNQR